MTSPLDIYTPNTRTYRRPGKKSRQVAMHIWNDIDMRDIPEGTIMPSALELAYLYGVTEACALTALRFLRNHGVVITRWGHKQHAISDGWTSRYHSSRAVVFRGDVYQPKLGGFRVLTTQDAIAEHIRQDLADRSIPYGTPLPTANVLGAYYGVSHSLMSHAIRTLKTWGVLMGGGGRARPVMVAGEHEGTHEQA